MIMYLLPLTCEFRLGLGFRMDNNEQFAYAVREERTCAHADNSLSS